MAQQLTDKFHDIGVPRSKVNLKTFLPLIFYMRLIEPVCDLGGKNWQGEENDD